MGCRNGCRPRRSMRLYARAAVGLCLSEVEGAMASSMEYMLAGLPIVSTPSRGGRDFYFDPDYCLFVDPNPRAVREAVESLRARNIPRDYVRARTLAKIEPERQRFVAFIEQLKESFGVPRSYGTGWSFSRSPIYDWRTVKDYADDFFGPAKPEARCQIARRARSKRRMCRRRASSPGPCMISRRKWFRRVPGARGSTRCRGSTPIAASPSRSPTPMAGIFSVRFRSRSIGMAALP